MRQRGSAQQAVMQMVVWNERIITKYGKKPSFLNMGCVEKKQQFPLLSKTAVRPLG